MFYPRPNKSRTVCSLTVLCLIFSCISYESCAEESENEKPVYLMEEIVISQKARTSSSETVMNGAAIKSRRAGSAADILTGIPGAVVSAGYKNSSEIMIRGFRPGDVLVMMDGRPVNDPYYGKIDLSTLGTGNTAKIRVVKGPDSVRYGPNAMGGVVNILTGSADDGPPVDLSFTAGSGKNIRANLIHRGHVKGIGYRIHAGRDASDGFPLSDSFEPTSIENGGYRDNSDSKRTDIGAKLFFGRQENPRWSLNVSGSHQKKGLPSSVDEPRFWRFRKWNRTAVDVDGEPVRKSTFRVKTKFYAERFVNELADYIDDSYDRSKAFWISTHDNRSAGLLISSAYSPGKSGITNIGLQMRWDESRRQKDRDEGWFLNRTATNWVFIEHERALKPYLILRGGISGQHFIYDSWKRSSFSLNPSLHLEWLLTEYTVTGSLSRVSRFPTLHQLYSSISGNPGLRPEWALNGEVTVSGTLLKTVHLSAAGFMSTIHDMIYRSGRLGIYGNVENAVLKGMEITGALELTRFDMYSSLSLLDARNGEGDELEYRPSWKVDSGINCCLYKDIRLHIISRIVGRRMTETGRYLESFHVENAGITVGEGKIVSVSLHVRNIFDSDYEEEMGYPIAGRTLWIGVDYCSKLK